MAVHKTHLLPQTPRPSEIQPLSCPNHFILITAESSRLPEGVARSYTKGSLGVPITGVSRTKSAPASVSQIALLSEDEWLDVHRNLENWNKIMSTSEMVVRDEHVVQSTLDRSYDLLERAMTEGSISSEGRKIVGGFLMNCPTESKVPSSLAEDWETRSTKGMAISETLDKGWVHPCGNFQQPQPLAIIFHYPTFSTQLTGRTQSADTTNGCTRMQLKTGLNPETQRMLWLEQGHGGVSTKITGSQVHALPAMPDPEAALPAGFVKRRFSQRILECVYSSGIV